IVTIYDYGEQDGQVYLVLEYIEGVTLEERLRQPVAAAEIQRIFSAVGSALDHAHSQSLIHRDVKPSNVLLHKDGRIVLSDFGIVKTLDAVTNVSLTGAVLGTPEYMAPEQFDDSPQIDARTDIYALGVMLYRVFAGRTPFQGSIISVANKHLHEAPPAVASPGHPVPAEVEAVILKALSKKPDDRYASAGEMSAALGQALLPPIMLEQARASVRRGDLERAEQIANQLLADNPANTAAGQLRADIDLARRGEAIV